MTTNTTVVSLPPDAQARLDMLANLAKRIAYESEPVESGATNDKA